MKKLQFSPPSIKDHKSLDNKVERIDYIDLAKGICIILVVLYHFSERWFDFPNIVALRMPLFFVLSGIFVRTKDNLKNFTIKKINTILIPYIFWFIMGIVLTGILNYESFYDLRIFHAWQDLNGPIWFLIALFNINIIFYFIQEYLTRNLRILSIFLIISLGVYCAIYKISLPLDLEKSLWFFPFFYLGYLFKEWLVNIQYKKNLKLLLLGIGAIIFSHCIYFTTTSWAFSFFKNHLIFDQLFSYINSLSYVIGVLFLCKVIKFLPIISYHGKYSLIVLCSHWLIMKVLYLISGGPIENPILKFVFLFSLLALCWLSIPILKSTIPYFVAQKPLIKTTNTIREKALE